MWRTGILAFFVSLVLVGCNFNLDVDIDKDSPEPTVIDTVNSDGITLVGLGEACGSKVETLCQTGLYCAYTPGKSAGECQPKDVDPDVVCEKIRKPVCGLKDRSKLSYLNECEAKRHGAEIVGDEFCAASENDKSCDGKVYSIGNCTTEFTGFEFKSGKCGAVTVNGCELDTPFDSLETCSNTCL